MKLQYTAALLIALGTTQAATTVTFAKDDKCTEFQGDKVSHSDKGCHKGRAESKSLSFSGIVASQKLCLVKFDNDDCDGSGVRQDVSVSLEDTANCRTIEKPEGQKSYKLEQNPCDGVSQPPEVGESMLTRFMRWVEDQFK